MAADSVESQLITQVLTGDSDAFSDLVRLYERPVYNLAYRMLGNSVEAEDAAQEAFIKAYSNLERYDMARSFKTWLLSITSNHCIDRLRKRRMTYLSIDEPLPPHPALVSPNASPEAAAIAEERSAAIQTMLDALPDDYRLIIVLRYWYDLSYAEIATMQDTSESAVKSRLFRARQALAKQFDPTTMPELAMMMEREA